MYKEQICFHMCELFGVNHINCGLMEKYSVEHDAQKLAELCQRAGKYNIVQCAIAEAKAPEAEFRIASLSLRDEVQINHQIKTPAAFNTFFRDDGCAEIKWAYPQNIISAKVRLFDEEKNSS